MPKAWSDPDKRQSDNTSNNPSGAGRSQRRSSESGHKERPTEGRTVSRRAPGMGSPNRRLEDRTVAELRNRAKVLGIGGRSKMNKEELVRAIRRKNG